jgi:hypothetical protein
MSRFLQYLGIYTDESIPSDIIQGGKLIDGLQMIYEDMPSGNKKDAFANAIAETASILMRRINTLKGITNEKVEAELKEAEMKEEEEKAESYTQEVEQIESAPNPTQDTELDKVDPPIDRSAPPMPTTDEDSDEVSDDLRDLIAQIHDLEF